MCVSIFLNMIAAFGQRRSVFSVVIFLKFVRLLGNRLSDLVVEVFPLFSASLGFLKLLKFACLRWSICSRNMITGFGYRLLLFSVARFVEICSNKMPNFFS